MALASSPTCLTTSSPTSLSLKARSVPASSSTWPRPRSRSIGKGGSGAGADDQVEIRRRLPAERGDQLPGRGRGPNLVHIVEKADSSRPRFASSAWARNSASAWARLTSSSPVAGGPGAPADERRGEVERDNRHPQPYGVDDAAAPASARDGPLGRASTRRSWPWPPRPPAVSTSRSPGRPRAQSVAWRPPLRTAPRAGAAPCTQGRAPAGRASPTQSGLRTTSGAGLTAAPPRRSWPLRSP